MSTILITGGTGTIGNRLATLLKEQGHCVNLLSRSKGNESTTNINGRTFLWNIHQQTIDKEAISTADFIIHLAGAGVADERWSKKRKQEIVESRTQSSQLIVDALTKIPNKVQAVISASAIGWYGPDRIDQQVAFDESENWHPDFLGETCYLWEQSISPVSALGKRLVILRTGIVLSNKGGAFVEFKKPLLLKVAAILGKGDQMISWIHVDDLCNQYIFAINNASMQGVYNAVAPNPVTNKELTITLAKKIAGTFFIPFYIPAFMLKIILGEMSVEVLKSTNVSASKILNTGYSFSYPTINDAINELTQ
jgi:uncharacterized protein (TIGR01777 family)